MGPRLTPTPLTRLLVRALLALCALSWLLSASVFGPGAAAPCEAATTPRRFPHRPIYCDHLTGLAVDLLNDVENLVPALKAKVGEIAPGGSAKFMVYALTDDQRFYANVTTETRATSFRIRPPRGGGSVAGTLRYSTASNLPVYVFTPDRETPEDRVAFFDVSYHCRQPNETYSTTFMLTIRGTDRTAQTNAAEAPGGEPRWKPEPAGCADVGITLEPTSGLLLHGQKRDVTIGVTNHGPEPLDSAVARIVFSNRLDVPFFYSPDDPGVAVRESERTLLYTTGPLAPGATAHLVVEVLGQTVGVAPITAGQVGEDCNPANDSAEGELTVSLPPVPELTGEWGAVTVVPPVPGERPRRQRVQGALIMVIIYLTKQ